MVGHEQRRSEVVERVHRIAVVMVTLDDDSHARATPLFDGGGIALTVLVSWLWCHATAT